MTSQPQKSPLNATQLVDEYFVENRNRLLEVAAFLDRIDRADPGTAGRDFRMQVFNEAVAALTSEFGPSRSPSDTVRAPASTTAIVCAAAS